MCGDFSPRVSSGTTRPASRPSPSEPSCSSERSNSSCMPRHSPITGTPAAARSRTTSSRPSARRRRIASGNAPTPGTTSPSATRSASWSALATIAEPMCANALSTERRLPIP